MYSVSALFLYLYLCLITLYIYSYYRYILPHVLEPPPTASMYAYLTSYIPTSMHAHYLFVCYTSHACTSYPCLTVLSTYISAIPTHVLHTCMHSCLYLFYTSLYTYMLIYLHTYMPLIYTPMYTYFPTPTLIYTHFCLISLYLRICVHPYIRTYLHTCLYPVCLTTYYLYILPIPLYPSLYVYPLYRLYLSYLLLCSVPMLP